ncbi:hypothetical protein L218DRAFT_866450, partial [Marasmius fiardii PR-910]
VTLAGFPIATEYGGTSLVTTDPAPIVLPRPIVTPGKTCTPAPSQQSSSILMASPQFTYLRRESTLVPCATVIRVTFGPIATLSPIMTRDVSRTVRLR